MADKIKSVVWTITNAVIVPGFGKDATAKQPIFEIKGSIKRSDSASAAKGETFKWTPALKAQGFKLDLSGFDSEKATGTIKVSGTIKQNGRKAKQAVSGDSLKALLDLA